METTATKFAKLNYPDPGFVCFNTVRYLLICINFYSYPCKESRSISNLETSSKENQFCPSSFFKNLFIFLLICYESLDQLVINNVQDNKWQLIFYWLKSFLSHLSWYWVFEFHLLFLGCLLLWDKTFNPKDFLATVKRRLDLKVQILYEDPRNYTLHRPHNEIVGPKYFANWNGTWMGQIFCQTIRKLRLFLGCDSIFKNFQFSRCGSHYCLLQKSNINPTKNSHFSV